MPIPTYEQFKEMFKGMTPDEQYNALKTMEEHVNRYAREFGMRYTYCVQCEAWRPKVYLSFGEEGTNTFECAVCLRKRREAQQPYFQKGETNESSN